MQIVIDIPQEVKQAFDKANNDDINFCFYDYNSIIGKAIKNGKSTGIGRRKMVVEIKEKILEYFADINIAYNDCTRYETLSNMLDEFAIEALQAQADGDAISRQSLLELMGEEPFNWTDSDKEVQAVEDYRNFKNMVEQLPSVKPQYTDDEIQKMQDLEQAELQKAYELGKAETEQFAKRSDFGFEWR